MNKLIVLVILSCTISAASLLSATQASPAANYVTLTGLVSCAKCEGTRTLPKGYTRWTWGLRSVKDGDAALLVVGEQTFTLKGDRNQIFNYMQDEATVTGTLEGPTLVVNTIHSAGNSK